MTKIAPGYVENDLITRKYKGMQIQLDITTIIKLKELKKHSRESHNDTIKRLVNHYESCDYADDNK